MYVLARNAALHPWHPIHAGTQQKNLAVKQFRNLQQLL